MSIETNGASGAEKQRVTDLLTPRQRQIFISWVSGEPVSKTAQRLGIAVATVDALRQSIIDNLMDGKYEPRRNVIIRAAISYVMEGGYAPNLPDGNPLTGREIEVCTLLIQGKRASEIAQSLGVTQSISEKYLSDIYCKLGLASLKGGKYLPVIAVLTAMAIRQGVLKPEDYPLTPKKDPCASLPSTSLPQI